MRQFCSFVCASFLLHLFYGLLWLGRDSSLDHLREKCEHALEMRRKEALIKRNTFHDFSNNKSYQLAVDQGES